jgi:hypothetical protein
MASKRRKREPVEVMTFTVTMTKPQCAEAASWLADRLAEFEGEEEELEDNRPGLLDALRVLHAAVEAGAEA